eukprot:g78626.t1
MTGTEASEGRIRGKIAEGYAFAKSVTEKAETVPIIKYGMDHVEWISTPLLNKAVEYGEPLVAKADSVLDQRFPANEPINMKEIASKLVPVTWFSRVDTHGFTTVWNASRAQWDSLRSQSKEEFMTGLKSRLAGFYDDKATVVAETFWKQASQLLNAAEARTQASQKEGEFIPVQDWTALRERTKAIWDSMYWENYMVSPAMKDAQVVSFAEFMQGMRDRLGMTYSQNLEKPLKEFYEAAMRSSVSELQRLQTKLQESMIAAKSQKDLTLGAVVCRGNDALIAIKDKGDALMQRPRQVVQMALNLTNKSLDLVLPVGPKSAGKSDASLSSIYVRVSDKAKVVLEQVQGLGPVQKIETYVKEQYETKYKTIVETKIESAKSQFEGLKAKVHLPELKEKFQACFAKGSNLTIYCKQYALNRPVKQLPADALAFMYQLPMLVTALLLGSERESSGEVENLAVEFAKSFVQMFFWWRVSEGAAGEAVAPGEESPSSAHAKKQEGGKKKQRRNKSSNQNQGKHKMKHRAQGSEPDMANVESDDETVSF